MYLLFHWLWWWWRWWWQWWWLTTMNCKKILGFKPTFKMWVWSSDSLIQRALARTYHFWWTYSMLDFKLKEIWFDCYFLNLYRYGSIERLRLVKDVKTGKSKGYAFVEVKLMWISITCQEWIVCVSQTKTWKSKFSNFFSGCKFQL